MKESFANTTKPVHRFEICSIYGGYDRKHSFVISDGFDSVFQVCMLFEVGHPRKFAKLCKFLIVLEKNFALLEFMSWENKCTIDQPNVNKFMNSLNE